MVEGLAEALFELLQGVEDPVCEIILPQVFPHPLHRVQLRAIGRKKQELHARGHAQVIGPMPTCAIQEHQAEIPGEFLSGIGQEDRHDLGIQPGHYQAGKASVMRRDRGQGMDKLPNHLLARLRPVGQRPPASPMVADPSETTLVLEQHPHPHPWGNIG